MKSNAGAWKHAPVLLANDWQAYYNQKSKMVIGNNWQEVDAW